MPLTCGNMGYPRPVTVIATAVKPDPEGGQWRLHRHDDDTAELWHRAPDRGWGVCVVSRTMLGRVRAYLREHGIGEDGWLAE